MLAVTVGMLLPTAVSLVKTRMVMTAMPRRRSTARVALLTAADLLLTLAIFLSLRWVVVRSISSRTKGLVEYSLWLLEEVFYPSPMDDTRGSEWVLFVGAALTSVWVWLYAASHGLSAVVAPFPRLRRRLDALAPDLSRPPRALGVVAVAAVVIVFFGVAPLVRLRRLTGA